MKGGINCIYKLNKINHKGKHDKVKRESEISSIFFHNFLHEHLDSYIFEGKKKNYNTILKHKLYIENETFAPLLGWSWILTR